MSVWLLLVVTAAVQDGELTEAGKDVFDVSPPSQLAADVAASLSCPATHSSFLHCTLPNSQLILTVISNNVHEVQRSALTQVQSRNLLEVSYMNKHSASVQLVSFPMSFQLGSHPPNWVMSHEIGSSHPTLGHIPPKELLR